MGKVLVIKGADFSENAIKTVDIDGKYFLNEGNADLLLHGYFSSDGTGPWVESANTTFLAWSISAGQIAVIHSTPENKQSAYLASVTNGVPQSKLTSIFECTAGYGGKRYIVADQDCYLFVLKKSDTEAVSRVIDPDQCKLDANALDYIVTIDSYDIMTNCYINAYGALGNGDNTRFYAIRKGDKVVVENDISSNIRLGFLSFATTAATENKFINPTPFTPTEYFGDCVEISEGVKAVAVNAGTTSEAITAPNADGLYLGITCFSGTDYTQFPKVNIIKSEDNE